MPELSRRVTVARLSTMRWNSRMTLSKAVARATSSSPSTMRPVHWRMKTFPQKRSSIWRGIAAVLVGGASRMEAKVSQGIRAEAGGPYCAGALLWNILRRMVFRSVLAAWSLAAAFGFSSLAQTSPAPAQQSPAPAQSPGQSGPTLHLQDLPPDPHTPTPAEAEQQRQQGALNAAMRLATLEA